MCKGGVSDQRRVAFRQNLAEMLIQVQFRHDTILIKKDGKPVAARWMAACLSAFKLDMPRCPKPRVWPRSTR